MRTWLRLSIVLALLGAGSGTSAQRGVVEYGGAGGDYAISGQRPRTHLSGGSSRLVPDTHTVRRGDTLWDITGYYFGNPWDWPRVWSYNPEITNPHWIYPDDSVRLRGSGSAEVAVLPSGASASGLRVTGAAPTDTIWLRQQGFLDRDALATAGVVSGSPEEQMLLSPYDDVYLQFGEDVRPEEGAQYTVFRRVDPESHERAEEGELVRILGTIRLDSYDPDERLGRGVVVEAIEPIERGYQVAIMDRALTMVPPRRNERDIEARVVASLRPTELVASQQVVFLDVGAEEGVQVGNRFFILRSGDAWRESNVYRSDRDEAIEDVPEPETYPEEIIAEGRVVNVRPHTATLFVSEARTDVRIGERAEMRRGF